jgi:hypothetical protein
VLEDQALEERDRIFKIDAVFGDVLAVFLRVLLELHLPTFL